MIRLIKYPHYCTDTIVLAVIFGPSSALASKFRDSDCVRRPPVFNVGSEKL